MNNKTHYTLSFYHLAITVRDTIEYVQNRKTCPKNIYQAKGVTIGNALKEESPLSGFCKSNGDIGKQIKTQLQDLYDLVYAEDAKFVSIDGENVVPDHSLNLEVLDLIIPLKQSLFNILRAYIDNQKQSNELEEGVEEIVHLEQKFYNAIINMVLVDLLFNRHFAEFNKVMRENQGKETPQSNFVVNDIKRVIGMINFIKGQVPQDQEEIIKAYDATDYGLKLITAATPLPEGSSFEKEFSIIFNTWYQIVAKLEPLWRENHSKIWNEIVAYEENAKKAQAN